MLAEHLKPAKNKETGISKTFKLGGTERDEVSISENKYEIRTIKNRI